MASWSQKRKFIYTAIIFGTVFVAASIPAYYLLYTPPNCFDNIMNGTETGIDCGGSCVRLCASTFLQPNVAWTRFEQVAPGLYNVAAYIINPNNEGGASRVPYRLSLYDSEGIAINEVRGFVTLPPHRNTLAFAGSVSVGKRTPTKALFEFLAAPDWRKNRDVLSSVQVFDKKYTEDASGSTLSVTIGNTSVQNLGPLSVYTVLYDKSNNAIGFSRTVVDEVPARRNVIAPFTWSIDRKGAVISIEVLPVAE